MTGQNKFSELRGTMSPEARQRADARSALLEQEMRQAELRDAMQRSRAELATALDTDLDRVADMEKRADLLVGTLGHFVEEIGGELELVARFPDHSIRIESFESLSEAQSEPLDRAK